MKCFTCMSDHDPDDACAPVKKEKKSESESFRYGEVIFAFYDGKCTGRCAGRIHRNEEIRKGPDGYVHEGCEIGS